MRPRNNFATTTTVDIEDYGTVEVTNRCCGAMVCRVLSPAIFRESRQEVKRAKNFTYVGRKIQDESEFRQVRRAVAACPCHAIRLRQGKKTAVLMMEDVNDAYPIPLTQEADVFLLGFYSPKNGGATTYLVRRPNGGNVLIDCPKPDEALIRRVRELGGAAYLGRWVDCHDSLHVASLHHHFLHVASPNHTTTPTVLTHKDHTAFHREWKEAFPGLKRVIHTRDIVEDPHHFFFENTADVEIKLAGDNTQFLDAYAVSYVLFHYLHCLTAFSSKH